MLIYLVELIGTFVFLSIILRTGEAIPIAIGLLSAIYFGGSISGGHFNPAVSFMMYLNNVLDVTQLPMYVLAQLTGGALALFFHKLIPN